MVVVIKKIALTDSNLKPSLSHTTEIFHCVRNSYPVTNGIKKKFTDENDKTWFLFYIYFSLYFWFKIFFLYKFQVFQRFFEKKNG